MKALYANNILTIGKYGEAIIHASEIEDTALEQIQKLVDQPMAEGAHIRIMPDVHAGAGCVIGYTAKVTDKVVPNLIGVDIGCLDKDSEFLTETGWKKMIDYIPGDKVLQYDKATDKASFTFPENYIVQPCSEFHHFKNSKGMDQMLSAEHKMLVFKGFKGKGYKIIDKHPAEISSLGTSLANGYYGFKASFNIQNEGIPLSENEIKLDIMLSADGYIRKQVEDKYNYSIHVLKERKILNVRKVLSANNIEFKEYYGQDKTTCFEFKTSLQFNKDLTKYFKASYEQLKIVASESLKWDGHKGYRSFFSSTEKSNADVIQFAFSAIDIRSGISVVKADKDSWKDTYVVTPTKNNVVGITQESTVVPSTDGKKYCFTVPDGYFVARRNGKIFVTGNCGVIAVELLIDKVPDLEELDTWVRKHIPTGRNIHSYSRLDEKTYMAKQVRDICVRTGQNYNYVASSLGTLGGGNHFIEMATDQEGRIWLLVHSGSRNFGLKIAKHYQNLAIQNNKGHKLNEIAELKKTYTGVELGKKIDEIPSMVHGLEYIVGEDAENYLNDATVAYEYALLNRSLIAGDIVDHLCYGMGAGCIGEVVNSVHNYTDAEQGIIRKGAIDASLNRWVVIPFNMRDGSIIGIGKGNEEWNYSAPHGAGRTMSRSQARAELSLEAFEEGMQGVYSTSVGASTIDEAPDAYKPFSDIIKYLEPTVEIKYTLKPVWNFKDLGGK